MPLLNKKRPVIFAGENHLITLYRPTSDEPLVWTSCWRCTYSEHGEGAVLFMRCERDDLPPLAIYSDNPPLARMVAGLFNQYFDGFRDLGLATLEPLPASFHRTADGVTRYQITCTAETTVIELVWHEAFDAALEIFDNTSGPIPYDVSAVICPCRNGAIIANGIPLAGEVRSPIGASASSAFLAFSETWVGV